MNIIKPVFLGILAAAGALVIESLFSLLKYQNYSLIFVFAAIEEFFLGLMIWKIARENYGKNILPNSILIGIGFSLIEIILNYSSGKIFLFSFLGLLLIHLSTALIFGYYFYFRKQSAFLQTFFIFLIATTLHFLFNLSVIYDLNQLIVFGMLAVLIASLSLKLLKTRDYAPLPIERK